MFEVLKSFKDIEDGHVYKKGDIFPFDKREVEDLRIQELSSKNNRLKTKLIVAKMKEKKVKEPKD